MYMTFVEDWQMDKGFCVHTLEVAEGRFFKISFSVKMNFFLSQLTQNEIYFWVKYMNSIKIDKDEFSYFSFS